jgi:hypothetical protein
MRVNVDGGKYTICGDDEGRLWVERGDCKDWMVNPAGGKMLLSAAYELACLRQIVAGVVKLLEYTDTGADTEAGWRSRIGGIEDTMRRLEGYADFKRSLNDPLDL